jgi:Ca2+-binding EF-hand superfamily protein
LAIDSIFKKYDVDNSGTLDTQEVKSVISDSFKNMNNNRSVTDDDVKKFLGAVDQNSDGKINKQELFSIFKRIIDSHFH